MKLSAKTVENMGFLRIKQSNNPELFFITSDIGRIFVGYAPKEGWTFRGSERDATAIICYVETLKELVQTIIIHSLNVGVECQKKAIRRELGIVP